MTYMPNSWVSWATTIKDLGVMFRRWGIETWGLEPKREPPARAEQAVRVWFSHPRRGAVELVMDRWNAPQNLRALYLSLDDLRMVEKRGLLEIVGEALRQLAPPRESRDAALAPWEVLGVPMQASPAEIHAAYRRLALEHHPDRGGEEWRMVAINSAYAALTRAT